MSKHADTCFVTLAQPTSVGIDRATKALLANPDLLHLHVDGLDGDVHSSENYDGSQEDLDGATSAVPVLSLSNFVKVLAGHRSLVSLRVVGAWLIVGDAIALASHLPVNLTELDVGGNSTLKDEGVSALLRGVRKHALLETLGLSGVGLTSVGCEDLAATILGSNLRALYLSDNCGCGDKGAAILAAALGSGSACKLCVLDLTAVGCGQHGAQQLAAALFINTTLKTLNVSSNPAIGVVGAAALARNARVLTSLILNRNALAPEHTSGAAVAGAHDRFAELWVAIAQNRSLQRFSLTGTGLLDFDVRGLLHELTAHDNTTLCALNLAGNILSGVGFDLLAERDMMSSDLSDPRREACTRFDLQHDTVLNSGSADADLSCKLAQASLSRPVRSLFSAVGLVDLVLSFNIVSQSGLGALARLITTSETLLVLALRHTCVDDDGALLIAAALATNPPLINLDLAHNSITALGAVRIADALRVNTNLQSIALQGNYGVGTVGVAALQVALEIHNTSILSLFVSDEAAQPAIAAAQLLGMYSFGSPAPLRRTVTTDSANSGGSSSSNSSGGVVFTVADAGPCSLTHDWTEPAGTSPSAIVTLLVRNAAFARTQSTALALLVCWHTINKPRRPSNHVLGGRDDNVSCATSRQRSVSSPQPSTSFPSAYPPPANARFYAATAAMPKLSVSSGSSGSSGYSSASATSVSWHTTIPPSEVWSQHLVLQSVQCIMGPVHALACTGWAGLGGHTPECVA